MFTGIVQEIGTVVKLARQDGVSRLCFHAPRTADGLALGESVAVNGACLSAVEVGKGQLAFEAIPETLRRTSLGRLAVGDRVNLERSLSFADRLNGHLVLGHVDGVGTVVRRRQASDELALDIRVDRELGRHIVAKGPITVDGVSLTVGQSPTRTMFSVFLIPETLRRTTLADLSTGSTVNIEVDYISKLVAQQIDRARGPRSR